MSAPTLDAHGRCILKEAALADAAAALWHKRLSVGALQRAHRAGRAQDRRSADPAVKAWWKTKADEIYRPIPDFGGFLVKANSEGQPGPRDYHRTHADGANMIADALAPHRGRCSGAPLSIPTTITDRAEQAYNEFKPLDGKFRDNVSSRSRTGHRLPAARAAHPAVRGDAEDPVMLEVQLTKEYLGQPTHLVYLGRCSRRR